jgi:AcrR family transcriptional regulator
VDDSLCHHYAWPVARWKADAADRLVTAALELYAKKGFDETTVAEVAAHAGLTERTFYRHFGDKREVLFGGARVLEDVIVKGVLDAPMEATVLESVAMGLEASAPLFEGRRTFAELRQRVILANPELHEREVAKMARLADAVCEALLSRGVTDPKATLASQAGIMVFGVAFRMWVHNEGAGFAATVRATLSDLRSVAAL